MQVEKVLHRLSADPNRIEELRRTGLALGDELPRRRLDVLRAFRSGIARFNNNIQPFACGYLSALTDVATAAGTAIEKEESEDRLWQALSPTQRSILHTIAKGTVKPSEIAQTLSKDQAMITRTLRVLREAGLVQPFAVEGGDRRLHPHDLTMRGKRIAAKLQESSQDKVGRRTHRPSRRPSALSQGCSPARARR